MIRFLQNFSWFSGPPLVLTVNIAVPHSTSGGVYYRHTHEGKTRKEVACWIWRGNIPSVKAGFSFVRERQERQRQVIPLAAQKDLWAGGIRDTLIFVMGSWLAEAQELGCRIPLASQVSFWKLQVHQVKNTLLLLLGMRTWPQKKPRQEGFNPTPFF